MFEFINCTEGRDYQVNSYYGTHELDGCTLSILTYHGKCKGLDAAIMTLPNGLQLSVDPNASLNDIAIIAANEIGKFT